MIKHFEVRNQCSLQVFINEKITAPYTVSELMELGCIYLNGKRVFFETQLKAGDYLRIHTNPKRYNINQLSLKDIRIFENDEFILLDKPPGLPVHATLDNYRENLRHFVCLTANCDYFVTSRLDLETSGLIVFAKTKEFLKLYNKSLQAGLVGKYYVVKTNHPVNLGLQTHFMKKSPRAPKEISIDSGIDKLICEMSIISCQQDNKGNYDLYIQLLTGRTHQIRAQLSFLGSPIIGDVIYGGRQHEQFHLKCVKLVFHDYVFQI